MWSSVEAPAPSDLTHQSGATADIDHSLIRLDAGKRGEPLGGTNVCAAGPRIVPMCGITIEVELQLPERVGDTGQRDRVARLVTPRRSASISTICAE